MARKKKKKINGRFYVICIVLILLIAACIYYGLKGVMGGGSEAGSQNAENTLQNQTEETASSQEDQGEQKAPAEIPLVTSEDGTPAASCAVISGTEYLYDGAYIIANPESYTCIVNRKYNLAPDYEPADLVKVTVPFAQRSEEVKYMRKDANDALTEMFQAAKDEAGYVLYGASGYRSYNIQKSLFSGNVQRKGSIAEANKVSALPGQSEHQLGLAMDITSESMNFSLTDDFYNTPEGKWVTENCYRFGFIIRYPADKTEITGYMYEPWHCRYVGTELAKELYETGLTLEEYYGLA